MRHFYVKPIKPNAQGFDWRVSAPLATRAYIALQRANDDPDYRDRLPQYFGNQIDALATATQLAETYAPAQVVLHYRPTVPEERNRW